MVFASARPYGHNLLQYILVELHGYVKYGVGRRKCIRVYKNAYANTSKYEKHGIDIRAFFSIMKEKMEMRI